MSRWLAYGLGAALCAATTSGALADRLVLLAEDTPGVTRIKINVDDIPFSLERPGPSVIDFVTPYRFESVNASQLVSSGLASRVANARLVPDEAVTRLRMVLNCDCGFDFSVSSGVLSVRIKDPVKAEVLLPEDETGAENVAKLGSQKPASPGNRPAPAVAPAPLARPTATAEESAKPAIDVASGDAQNSAETSQTTQNPGPAAGEEGLDPTDEVVLARDHLMRQLSRAAEQGLIQFVSDEAAALAPEAEDVAPRTATKEMAEPAKPAPEPVTTKAAADEPPSPAETALVADAPPNPVEIPLRARTAVDKDFRADRSETRAVVAYCIDQKRLDLPSWAQPGPFLETTSSLRSDLLDDYDNPRPKIATKLVRHLVVNGFGAEAKQMLTLYGDVIEDSEILHDIARLVDLEAARPDGLIARTAPCHPEATLWRKIAGLPDGEPAVSFADDEEEKVDDGQFLENFARLPAITRRILGARLMDNLIAKGEFDLAKQLDLILLRSPSDYSDALALSRARLLGETGRLEEAEALYSQLSKSNRPEAQTALILLLESRISRGAGGSTELSEALGDAAFSARGTDLELPLKVAEIRSRTLTDGASKALQTLQEAMDRSGGGSELLRDVGHAALETLAPVDGDTVDYAKAVMAMRPYVSEGPTGDLARRRVAEFLTDAGLPNLAMTYLEPTIARADAATSLVAAQALLALGEVEQALAVVEDQTDPKAVALKAEALGRLGRHEEANQLAADLANVSDEMQSARALRAGDWEGAASAGDRPQRLLAAYMASQDALEGDGGSTEAETDFLTTPEIDRDTTLESVRSVVEASKSARSIIEKALEDG